jgi:hypothetical protein
MGRQPARPVSKPICTVGAGFLVGLAYTVDVGTGMVVGAAMDRAVSGQGGVGRGLRELVRLKGTRPPPQP